MKIIAFPTAGCGGILCALVNNIIPEYYDNKFVYNEEHNILKLWDSYELSNDELILQWENKISNNLKNNDWLGTHIHPSYFKDDLRIEKIIYINCNKLESISWLATRHFFYCRDNNNFSLEIFFKKFLEFLLTINWFSKTQIYTKQINDQKIINLELCDFVFDASLRKNFFIKNNLNFNEQFFNDWLLKNDYNKFYPIACKKMQQYYDKILLDIITL